MILLDSDIWPGSEPDLEEIQGYYLPERHLDGSVLYGSCMCCGMTIAHEHKRSPLDTPAEHDAARLPHEVCDDCWEWFTGIVCALDPRLQADRPEPTRTI